MKVNINLYLIFICALNLTIKLANLSDKFANRDVLWMLVDVCLIAYFIHTYKKGEL